LHCERVFTLVQSEFDGLYNVQKEALISLKLFFQNPDMPNIALVVMPTGCGKSGVAALSPYVINSTKVLFITPSVQITDQIMNDFWYHIF
jgi:superfamily II DNA or RNA helicase